MSICYFTNLFGVMISLDKVCWATPVHIQKCTKSEQHVKNYVAYKAMTFNTENYHILFTRVHQMGKGNIFTFQNIEF